VRERHLDERVAAGAGFQLRRFSLHAPEHAAELVDLREEGARFRTWDQAALVADEEVESYIGLEGGEMPADR
jgi:hypothetical protein